MTYNPDWYPEDYLNNNLGEDVTSVVTEIQTEQAEISLQQIANQRLLAQNTIANQNKGAIWEEDLLPYPYVGKIPPDTSVDPIIIEPRILISNPVVDFGEVEIGGALEYRTVTIFAADGDLTISHIFWTSTDKLHFANPPSTELNLRQIIPSNFSEGAVLTIPENDYRYFQIGYGPQVEEVLNEEVYIISSAVNSQPTATVGGITYNNVTTISLNGTSIDNSLPPAPTPIVHPEIPPEEEPTPFEEPEPTRGTKAIIIGGENGFTVIEDRVIEEFNFLSEISTTAPSLTEERQWAASFGSIDKAYVIGGSKNQRTVQTRTADIYEYYARVTYRTLDDLNIPLDMCSGTENAYKGYTFGGDNFLGGSRNEIRETDLNANNIVLLSSTMSEPRSLHQATEGDFTGSFIFGGAKRFANASATRGFNYTLKSNISHYSYATTANTAIGEILEEEQSFRLGSHSNYQNIYLGGGGGNGSESVAEYGGIYSQKITKFNKETQLLVPFSRTLSTGVDSPAGFGGNKVGYFAAGYTGTGTTSTERIRGTRKIQKLRPLETNQSEVEFIVPMAETLTNYHSGGAVAQTEDYCSGWYG